MNKEAILPTVILSTTLFISVYNVNAKSNADLISPATTFHTAVQAVSSVDYLPPPPLVDSPAFALDKAAYQDGYAMKDSARWQQATRDADLSTANLAEIFSEPLGITISEKTTPVLYKMLAYMVVDAGDYASRSAKQHYMRERPFAVYHHRTCQPESDDAQLRKNGSYPCGHTAIGQSIGLILAQLRPDRAEQIMKRSYEFGQSRVVCDAHWQSDVNAGRIVGGVEYSRLQTLADFRGAMTEMEVEIDRQVTQLRNTH